MESENIYNFIKPEQYITKLDIEQSGLKLILDEFKKLYVLSQMYPQNEDLQNQFNNVTNNLKQVLSNLFLLSNEVQQNIDNMSNMLIDLNVIISKERDKNTKLKKNLGIIENKNNASVEMINNYKEIYDNRYLRNWALGLSTLLCVTTIGILYKKQEV